MTDWRETSSGERQWLGSDGNWYSSEQLAMSIGPPRPGGSGPPPAPEFPGIYSQPTHPLRATKPRYSQRSAKTAILVFWAIVAVIVVIVIISNATRSSPSTADASYIGSHQQDFQIVTAGISNVQTEVGLLASGSSSGDINQLASSAEELHGSFDNVHTDLLSDNSSSGVIEVWTASGELRDSMADLAAYTGNPNPATLARFTTNYDHAAANWNQGVDDLWASAHEKMPPTIPVNG